MTARKTPGQMRRNDIKKPTEEQVAQARNIVALIADDISRASGLSPLMWNDPERKEDILAKWRVLAVSSLMGLL